MMMTYRNYPTPWFIVLALAASLSLPACFSRGVVVDPQTPAEHALVGIGNARGAVILAYDDVVFVHMAGNITQAQANAKLDDLDRYRAALVEAEVLVVSGGSIKDANDKVAAVRAFLVTLKAFLDTFRGG